MINGSGALQSKAPAGVVWVVAFIGGGGGGEGSGWGLFFLGGGEEGWGGGGVFFLGVEGLAGLAGLAGGGDGGDGWERGEGGVRGCHGHLKSMLQPFSKKTNTLKEGGGKINPKCPPYGFFGGRGRWGGWGSVREEVSSPPPLGGFPLGALLN